MLAFKLSRFTWRLKMVCIAFFFFVHHFPESVTDNGSVIHLTCSARVLCFHSVTGFSISMGSYDWLVTSPGWKQESFMLSFTPLDENVTHTVRRIIRFLLLPFWIDLWPDSHSNQCLFAWHRPKSIVNPTLCQNFPFFYWLNNEHQTVQSKVELFSAAFATTALTGIKLTCSELTAVKNMASTCSSVQFNHTI